MRPLFALLVAASLLASCSRDAPAGKWQGALYDGRWLIAVRLEISSGNVIRVSAPNLKADFAAMTAEEREASFAAIARQLDALWRDAAQTGVTFSGGRIVRENGYATLFEYDETAKRMIFNFYGDGTLSHRVPLDPVPEFAPLARPAGL